jgi:hypothetical protein
MICTIGSTLTTVIYVVHCSEDGVVNYVFLDQVAVIPLCHSYHLCLLLGFQGTNDTIVATYI